MYTDCFLTVLPDQKLSSIRVTGHVVDCSSYGRRPSLLLLPPGFGLFARFDFGLDSCFGLGLSRSRSAFAQAGAVRRPLLLQVLLQE